MDPLPSLESPPESHTEAAELLASFFSHSRVLELARTDLAARCLGSRGIDPRRYRDQATEYILDRPPGRGPSGLVSALDPEVARRQGYPRRPSPASTTAPGAADDQVVAEALSPSSSTTVEIDIPGVGIVGAKVEGCIAEANSELYGSVQNWLILDQYVPATIRSFADDALSSDAVEAATRSYVSCMDLAGFDTANPAVSAERASNLWGSRTAEEEPSSEELLMAIADARCQAESRIFIEIDDEIVRIALPWVEDDWGVVSRAIGIREHALTIAANLGSPRQVQSSAATGSRFPEEDRA